MILAVKGPAAPAMVRLLGAEMAFAALDAGEGDSAGLRICRFFHYLAHTSISEIARWSGPLTVTLSWSG